MKHSKRLFILNGNPAAQSLCRALSERYAEAAGTAGHTVTLLHLHDLSFDADYGFSGYSEHKPLERDLETVMQAIENCDHFVLVTPMWWGGLPAKLKGLFDRAFLPGKAFDTRNTTALGLPKPLLVGRSARVIVTSDTPRLFFALLYRNALLHQVRGQILAFVGFKPTKVSFFSGASHPSAAAVDNWLTKVGNLGAQAA